MLLTHLLRRVVKQGTLTLVDASGRSHVFGAGGAPRATLRLHDKALKRSLFWNGALVLGEAYMDERLSVVDGDIYDLLAILVDGTRLSPGHVLLSILNRASRIARRVQQFNPMPRAVRNVAHHYDLSDELYRLYLDRDRQYSCAYFISPDDNLERAQENKKCHIAAKLLLEPGHRVLDIGSGWGGLGLYLAGLTGVEVSGITLSKEQLQVSTRRAAEAGLADKVHFELRDYRHVEDRFDRIVSVGMFEHVGVNHYRSFFEKVRDLLTDDGIALLHSIGRFDGPGATNPWIRKYIFPGGYTPALSEVLPVIERTGLYVTDIEILRLHYAETLKEWRRRFIANWDKVAAIYDERFCRMWNFYLAGSEASFRFGGLMVFQIQLAKRQDAVPQTRDYITEWERGHLRASTVAAE